MPGCSGHSMRVGFCTEAVAAGASARKIGALGRWRSKDMQTLYDKSTVTDGINMGLRLSQGGISRDQGGLLHRPTRARHDGREGDEASDSD